MSDQSDDKTQSSQETAVGHSVVDEPGAVRAEGDTEVFFSRDEAQQQGAAPTPPPPSQHAPSGGTSPAEADRIAADQHDPYAEKPHIYAAGAFAGAFVIAQIMKRITAGDDD